MLHLGNGCSKFALHRTICCLDVASTGLRDFKLPMRLLLLTDPNGPAWAHPSLLLLLLLTVSSICAAMP